MRPDSPPRSGMERRSLAMPMQLLDPAVQAAIPARDDLAAPTLPRIVGHAAVFGQWTSIGGLFEECVRPGAFDNALREGQDVRCLANHDDGLILGRTTAGTLRLSVDEIGLAYECDPADTSYARDLIVSMGRKDVTQSSFAFRVRPGGEIWTSSPGEGPDGTELWRRELIDLDLFDVSPVTFPAYDAAESGLRSLKAEQERRGVARPARRPDPIRERALRFALAR